MSVPPLAGRSLGNSDGSFVLVEWTDDRESSRDHPVTPVHAHLDEDEAWYVLEGRLGCRVGDEEVEAGRGAGVLVPRGTPHTYWNAGSGCARYLLVMGPTTFRLIEALHTASHDGEAMRELLREHASELLA